MSLSFRSTPAPWLERTGGFGRRFVLLVLLLAPLAASVVLAWQAWRLASQYRAAVDDAIGLQVDAMHTSFERRVEARLWMLADATLQEPHRNRSLEGEDILETIEKAVRELPDCRCGPVVSAESFFWLDLESGESSVRSVSAASVPAFDAALIETIRERHRTLIQPSQTFSFEVVSPSTEPRLLLYNWRDRAPRQPLLFGFVAEPSSLGSEVFEIARRSVALPTREAAPNTTGANPLSARITDRGDHPLWESSPQHAGTYSVRRPFFRPTGSLVATVSLEPATASSLISGGLPRSPLPLLLAIVAGSTLFAGLGLLLLRRADQLQRMQQELTARITHELRTPLTQILLYGESLHLNRLPSPERRQHALLVILRETRHLIHLIDNALIFARAGRSSVGLAPEPLALARLVEEVADGMAPLFNAQDANLELDLDREATAEADPTALRQVVRNLLDNALRHGGRGKTLRVAIVRRETTVELTIDDEGPGIPVDERERVLQPFVRLSSRGTGSGLGLAIVKQLVELMRGGISFEDAPGGGCRARVRLPAFPNSRSNSLRETAAP